MWLTSSKERGEQLKATSIPLDTQLLCQTCGRNFLASIGLCSIRSPMPSPLLCGCQKVNPIGTLGILTFLPKVLLLSR